MFRRLTRRQLLTSILAGGVTATGIHEFFRLQAQNKQKSIFTELFFQTPDYADQSLQSALAGDRETIDKLKKIDTSFRLTPPNLPYNRPISKLLILCCRIGTEQYLYGKYKPDYDGLVNILPGYSPELNSYSHTASIRGLDDTEITENIEVSDDIIADIQIYDPLSDQLDEIEKVVKEAAGEVISIRYKIPVYWGFVLSSPQANLMVFRGTQQTSEWIQNIIFSQVDSAVDTYSFKFVGKVHQGFAEIYDKISEGVIAIAKTLNPTVPCYISGHSLGAALATLAAMDIGLRVPELTEKIQLYTYASPRVGDISFAEAHSELIPNSYRVANLADAITLLPLSTLTKDPYVHLGQEWSFLNQSGDLAVNHFTITYRQAVDAEAETNRTA